VANLASFRSAQGVDCAFHVLVRVGIIDSFHFAEHRQVQLAGWALAALGGCAAYVIAARHCQALALFADGSGRKIDPVPRISNFRPLPKATFDGIA
jgi:hypothetical protein